MDADAWDTTADTLALLTASGGDLNTPQKACLSQAVRMYMARDPRARYQSEGAGICAR